MSYFVVLTLLAKIFFSGKPTLFRTMAWSNIYMYQTSVSTPTPSLPLKETIHITLTKEFNIISGHALVFITIHVGIAYSAAQMPGILIYILLIHIYRVQ